MTASKRPTYTGFTAGDNWTSGKLPPGHSVEEFVKQKLEGDWLSLTVRNHDGEVVGTIDPHPTKRHRRVRWVSSQTCDKPVTYFPIIRARNAHNKDISKQH